MPRAEAGAILRGGGTFVNHGFFDRVSALIAGRDTLLCVGLDPPLDLEEDVEGFCARVIDATADSVCCYKPNSAFFEARGSKGIDALIRTVRRAHETGTPVILDAKRGDIASTALAYAAAAFDVIDADAVTVNPYLGRDSVEPFVSRPGRGVFLLCHTSNPGAADLQTLEVGGEPLYRIVARMAAEWEAESGTQNAIGLVVGATYPEVIAEIRRSDRSRWLLLPGVGAQGGGIEGVRAACSGASDLVIVNSSRSIILSDDPGLAARRTRERLNAARSSR